MLDIHLRGHEKVAAMIDVSVGGVSVAICVRSSSGETEIRATGHSKLSLEPRTPEQAASQIGGQIAEAAEIATRQFSGGSAITRAYIILHAPWAASHTMYAGDTYEREAKVHDAMIGKLAAKAVASAGLDRTRLIESSVVRVELNGYPTASPSGKTAHQLSVVAIVSECDPALKSTIDSAVAKAFPVAQLLWRSAARALTAFGRSSGALDHHFTVIDMGIDTSHIISVRGATITEKTVSEGTRTILARISGGRQPEEVLSGIRMLERDATSSANAEALQKSLALAEQDLVRPFAEAIGAMAASTRVAGKLLLLVHPDLEPWLSRFFSRIDFAQFTATASPFTVLTPQDIASAQQTPVADNEFIVSAALFNTESTAAA